MKKCLRINLFKHSFHFCLDNIVEKPVKPNSIYSVAIFLLSLLKLPLLMHPVSLINDSLKQRTGKCLLARVDLTKMSMFIIRHYYRSHFISGLLIGIEFRQLYKLLRIR